MALPDVLVAHLIDTIKSNDLSGRFAMLGRQRWIGTRKGASARLLADTMAKYLPGVTEDALHNADDAYSEALFKVLGFSQVDSIDYSPFEGASIVHDMTKKLPKELRGAFDVIYDGGTCEHIFELPKAYANIDKALKPGGVLIGHSPCNNWINHGFYQICPEMIYGYWEKARGYEVIDVILQPFRPAVALKGVRTTNPNVTGVRPRLLGVLPENAPVMINYVVRKPLTKKKRGGGVYQTDYMNKWDDAEAGADAEA
ncbi:class I SAM-dependent methyltransferase [Pseudorhodobacter sp.]|uniref:class I SAM-dependent methyltransferase n=1 Tax=Pseudorhodobacter sp. TaxID=1934400 RepID=UPI0026488256|nr:class I SAM-dependent methyltransferase [Pseudorhodobacter sp.]MDN5786452.1 class I SAM-dependent methyltransferase [Pseudorhodobacter sp.]